MNPACLRCQGACCEEFSLPAGTARDDVSRWFALHGSSSLLPGGIPVLRFECTCTALSPSGLCSIYHARPDLCRTFEAGGAACREVLERRLNNSWPLPNLILVDGGIGQVNIARLVLRKRKLDIPVVGLAKGPERKRNDVVGTIPPGVPLATLVRIRDEAHRFAVRYHRTLRDATGMT